MDVKTLCLGVLSRGDHSGYEIRKQFETGPFAHFQDAGFGSIYPALKKLTEDGHVVAVTQAQDGRPDKKVYRITAKGRQVLFDAVTTPPGEDKIRSDFLFVLCFADLVAPGDLDRMIEARMAFHRGVIESLEAKGKEARRVSDGQDFVRRYGIAMHRAALTFLDEHRHELLGAQFQRDVAE